MVTSYAPRAFGTSPALTLLSLLAVILVVLQTQAADSVPTQAARAPGKKVKPLQGKQCTASNLTGYTSSKILKEGLILHWKPNAGNTIDIAVEARVGSGAVKGWFALAFSKTAAMGPADAVIAQTNTAPVAAFNVSGFDPLKATRTNKFSIGDASLERSTKRTIMYFTRKAGDGIAPVKVRGWNNIVWAHDGAGEKELVYFGAKYGKLAVNFGCIGGAPASDTPVTPAPGSKGPAPTTPAAPAIFYCPKSTLPGYNFAANLSGGSFVMHWKRVQGKLVHIALEAKANSLAQNGWFGIGWSRDGKMIPSYSVIKSGGAVAAYYINGYKVKNVVPTTDITLGVPVLKRSAAGSLIAQFTLTAGQGKIPLLASGLNYILWGHSTGIQSIGFHGGNAGWVKIDFSCAFWADTQDSETNKFDTSKTWSQDLNQASSEYYASRGTSYWQGFGHGVASLVTPVRVQKRLRAAEARRKAERDAYNNQVARQVYGPQQDKQHNP